MKIKLADVLGIRIVKFVHFEDACGHRVRVPETADPDPVRWAEVGQDERIVFRTPPFPWEDVSSNVDERIEAIDGEIVFEVYDED